MNLEEKIIAVLSEGKPLKGREIATLLATKYGIQVDKTEVNSLLHRKLRDKAEQNKNYQWSLKAQSSKGSRKEVDSASKETALSKLSYYYLECLSKDMDSGISVFATSQYNPNYSQLTSFPLDQDQAQTIENHLLGKVRRDQNTFVFKLGYPMLIRSATARNGNSYRMAEPLFIFTMDTEYALKGGHVKLTDNDPVLNPKALESITGISSSSELLLEIVELYDELGINNDPEDKPALDEMFQRIEQIRSDWKWNEALDITKLKQETIASLTKNGLYNVAAVFVGEKSKYTVGLEKDLKDLSKIPEDNYQNSALGNWINDSIGDSTISDKVLIEPIPLNEEQREAILKGLSSHLTVVTGPPGTGKSQVVASLIVNAVYQGQTVLFSSKNNKAVDVVNDRVNALTDRQVMLRLGSRFQATLAEYLSSLLSARPSGDDESRYKEAKDIHDRLLQLIESIRQQQEQVIKVRNEVDKIESIVENLREELGADFFAACESLNLEALNNLDPLIHASKLKLDRADKTKQSFFVKLFWKSFSKERFGKLKEYIDSLSLQASSLEVSTPAVPIDDASIHLFERFLSDVASRNTKAKQIKKYFVNLAQLNKAEDLFSLSLKEKEATDQVVSNSLDLWNYWLQLLPNRMTQNDRRVIGDYVAVLNLIVAAQENDQQVDRGVWSKYYALQPKIMHILSCWAVTSLSVRGRGIPLEAAFFDLVIIDEASQCDIASALPLLYRAKRAVIIGDDKQLTHISAISETQDIHLLGKYNLDDQYMGWSYAATSLFRLAASRCKPENIVVLRDHHRSHADIINYSNQFFYQNTLRVATKYENLKSIPREPAVRWLDVKGKCMRPETGSSYNDREAEEVVKELSRLVGNGYKGTIGVVTPFRAQYLRIQDKINQNKDLADRLMLRDFLCDTVHKFQGDERDVMLFSSVVSTGVTEGAVSFLKRTGNLFNVAITRARAALVVVGDSQVSYHSGIPHYKGFVEYINQLENREPLANEKIVTDHGPRYPKVNTRVMISDWEKYLYEALYRAGIPTIPQHQVGQYSLDLAIMDGERKLNIEVDGEKYHRNWDGELMRRDQLRNKRLIELGWDVQRFWVYQVRDNMRQCIEKIKEWKG
jgi:very-short-patch-repair endonuclease